MFADYSSTGPGVSTGGSVGLGTCSHIGIGASVRHGVSIGDYSVIGGQSSVNRAIGDNKIAYGIPVREVGERSANAAYISHNWARCRHDRYTWNSLYSLWILVLSNIVSRAMFHIRK